MRDSELIIDNLCNHGFHVIDGFLETEPYHSLRSIAEEMYQRGQYRSAKIGFNSDAQHNNTIRGDEIAWMDDHAAEPAIKAYLTQTNALLCLLNQDLFLGLSEFESHFAAYQSGAFYKKHVDQFATTKTRKISCVYYLNDHWSKDFGGELTIYNKDDQLIQTVFPEGNRFICFTSDLPHEVCVTHKTRYSIAGWMKTRSLMPISI